MLDNATSGEREVRTGRSVGSTGDMDGSKEEGLSRSSVAEQGVRLGGWV